MIDQGTGLIFIDDLILMSKSSTQMIQTIKQLYADSFTDKFSVTAGVSSSN